MGWLKRGLKLSQSTDLSEAARRRMAVGKGLRCLPLDEMQMGRALTLWDHLFEAGNQAIPHYVDTMAALLHLTDNERHVAKLSILREMITASLDLRPAPQPNTQQEQAAMS